MYFRVLKATCSSPFGRLELSFFRECGESSQCESRFSDSLEELTELSSWLWLITVKDYQKKSAKTNKKNGAKYRGNLAPAFKSPLPIESHFTHLFPLASGLWEHIWNIFYQGSSLKIQHPRFSLEMAHIGMFCLADTYIPKSQRESKYSA